MESNGFSYLLSHETICRTHQLYGVSKQIQISGQALTMATDTMHMDMLRTHHMHMVLMLDIASIPNRLGFSTIMIFFLSFCAVHSSASCECGDLMLVNFL